MGSRRPKVSPRQPATGPRRHESASEQHQAADRQDAPPPCPFCESNRTEIMSLFGSHASLTTCWCADCRSPFEFLRWRGEREGREGGG